MTAQAEDPLVSVVIPCLNECGAVAGCVADARAAMHRLGARCEVIVVDNGSTDASPAIATAAGATVVHEPRRGYGSAYLRGFAAARGRYVVMGDADGTYDFGDLGRFVQALNDGADFVIGSRLRGEMHPGSMSWLRRYVGNPLLTRLLNGLHGVGVSDGHCGMRAFRREILPELDLRSTGMELASEQLVRSAKLGLNIVELPIEYRPRTGTSKLSPFGDGLRHLRLLFAQAWNARP